MNKKNMSARGGSAFGGKKIFIFSLIIILAFSFLLAATSQASTFGSGLKNTAQDIDIYDTDQPTPIETYAANFVKSLLALVGAIFLVIFLYGGFLYMTSRGNEEKVKKGKNTLLAATIGILIILTGYSITVFITSGLEGNINIGGTLPTYREECENAGNLNYHSIGCCEYRFASYGTTPDDDCCRQSIFCDNHPAECGACP